MRRTPHQFAFALVVAMLPSVAKPSTPIGGYYLQDRTLTSPIPDSTGINLFGVDVAVSDGIALVGASRESDTGNAHLYDSHSGALLHTLTPDNRNVRDFGRMVALEEKYAVVGSNRGTYVYDIRNYELLHILPGSGPIDIDGELVFVGGSGVYDLSSGDRLAKTNLSGTSVALSGNYAIAGYIGQDSRLVPGYAVVLDWKNQRQLYDLTPDDMPNGAEFGISVAADRNIAVIGARGDGGSAYVFDLTTGKTLHRLEEARRIHNPVPTFGHAVTIHGDIAVVAAFRETGYFPIGPGGQMEHILYHGAAFAFSIQTGEEIARFTSGSLTSGEANYGFALDYDGRQLIAGTIGWPKNAYITDFAIPEPCALVLLMTPAILVSVRRSRS